MKEMKITFLFLWLIAAGCQEKSTQQKVQIKSIEKNHTAPVERVVLKQEFKRAKEDSVLVSYTNRMNDYKVNVVWEPKSVMYDMIVGKANLILKKSNVKFEITSSHFAVPAKDLGVEANSAGVSKLRNQKFNLRFHHPKTVQQHFLKQIETPFFFYDFNDDGLDELVITNFGQGQRGGNSFRVYRLDKKGGLISNDLQITNKKPYVDIDFMTKIDKIKKELIVYSSGGSCLGSNHTYTIQKGEYNLTKIVKHEREGEYGEKCVVYTYNVVNGKRELFSKEEK